MYIYVYMYTYVYTQEADILSLVNVPSSHLANREQKGKKQLKMMEKKNDGKDFDYLRA